MTFPAQPSMRNAQPSRGVRRLGGGGQGCGVVDGEFFWGADERLDVGNVPCPTLLCAAAEVQLSHSCPWKQLAQAWFGVGRFEQFRTDPPVGADLLPTCFDEGVTRGCGVHSGTSSPSLAEPGSTKNGNAPRVPGSVTVWSQPACPARLEPPGHQPVRVPTAASRHRVADASMSDPPSMLLR